MTSSSWTLQAAVFAALAADAGLQALLGSPPRFYDSVPPDAVLPYAVLGDWQRSENDTDDARIDAHSFIVDVWSSYAGFKEAKAIAAAIEAVLHGAPLVLEGYALVDLAFTGAVSSRDEKSALSQCALRFRALTEAST